MSNDNRGTPAVDMTRTPEPNRAYGTQQRLRLIVPVPRSLIHLGKELNLETCEVPGDEYGSFGYPGISMHSQENLFVDIARRSLIQGQKEMFLQSGSEWRQASRGNMFISTPEMLQLSGQTLFLGAGGLFHGPEFLAHVGKEIDPKLLSLPNWDEFSQFSLSAGDLYFKSFLPILSFIKTALTFSKPSDPLGWFKLAMSAGQFVDKVAAKLTHTSKPASLSLYGAEGIYQASPNQISLTSTDKISINGALGVGVNALRGVSLQSIEGISLFGLGKVGIEAAAWADVKAGFDVGISSLRTAVKLKGKKISIGGTKYWTQVATKEVKLEAPEGSIAQLAKTQWTAKVGPPVLKIEAPKRARANEIGAAPDKKAQSEEAQAEEKSPETSTTIPLPHAEISMKADGGGSIALEAKKRVTITVGKFTICVGDSITIRFNTGDVDSDAQILVDEKGIHLSGESIELLAGTLLGSSRLKATKEGFKLNGRQMKLDGDVIKLG